MNKKILIDFIESGDWKKYKAVRNTFDKIREKGKQQAANIDKQAKQTNTAKDKVADIDGEIDRLTKDVEPYLKQALNVVRNTKGRAISDETFDGDWFVNTRLNNEYIGGGKMPDAKYTDTSEDMFKANWDDGMYDNDVYEYLIDEVDGYASHFGKTINQDDFAKPSEELLTKRKEMLDVAKETVEKYNYKVPKDIEKEFIDEFNELQKLINESSESSIRENMISHFKLDKGVQTKLRELKPEYEQLQRVRLTNESKQAIADSINEGIFKRKGIVKVDASDDFFNEFVDAYNKKDAVAMKESLRDIVQYHNYDKKDL